MYDSYLLYITTLYIIHTQNVTPRIIQSENPHPECIKKYQTIVFLHYIISHKNLNKYDVAYDANENKLSRHV